MISTSGLVALLVQDLSTAFFSQEVLHGERALGDARARLEALWDKLMELMEERDQARRAEGAGEKGCRNVAPVSLIRLNMRRSNTNTQYA